MIKEIFSQNVSFRSYSYFFLFNLIGGSYLAYSFIKQSPYLAVISVIICCGLVVYFCIWILWLYMILDRRKHRQNPNLVTFNNGITDHSKPAKKLEKAFMFFAMFLFLTFILLIVVMFD